MHEGRAKSLRTFLIIFIMDVRLFSYFQKSNNGLLAIFEISLNYGNIDNDIIWLEM